MNTKLSLPLCAVFLAACSNTTNITNYKESAIVNTYDGTWIVRQTANTPVKTNLMKSKYFQYYSGLHAESIGCKSYSQINLKVKSNEKAYKCIVNGTFLTKNSLAIGTPWQ